VEVERGCSWDAASACRQCVLPDTLPPKERIIEQAKQGFEYRDRIGLVGAVVSDHPQIEEILAAIRNMGAGISISSMRIKPLYDSVLKAIVESGAQTVTLAPEAGSQRLRNVINKHIDKDDIMKAVHTVSGYPIKMLKLYFMIGLPSENDEDIEEMVSLVTECREILYSRRTGCRIDINVAPFIPKAGTSFQWMPMDDEGTLNRRLAWLRKKLAPLGVQVKNESVAWSHVQGVLSRGDLKIAELMAAVENISLAQWRQKARELKIDPDHYTVEKWGVDDALPWGMLETGIPQERLIREMEKALSI
jgi:radical SAM superfamily enzyme YgiQ (UPF0313 family)